MEEVKDENKDIVKDENKENVKEKNKEKKLLKFNPIIVLFGTIVIIILIVLLINGIFNSKKERIIIEAKSTQEKIVDKSELRTVTYTYNGIAKKCKKECENNDKDDYLYFVSYKGTVTAGIDFNKLEYKIENKKLIITIPDPIISGHNIKVGESKYIFVNEKYNVSSEINNAYELCINDLESRTKNNKLILNTAKENAINIIKQFYKSWLEKNYPDYELEVK